MKYFDFDTSRSYQEIPISEFQGDSVSENEHKLFGLKWNPSKVFLLALTAFLGLFIFGASFAFSGSSSHRFVCLSSPRNHLLAAVPQTAGLIKIIYLFRLV